ncbi:rod shape-determining protein RodA [Dulcicalothrix desertica PCC 7102]|uniref:Rod shape-determining protein RodA n=1 Tax=Dulcicalothrix desertica PCC 7102 TaxID=232991 RepID=A0A3S1CMM3_9CYAN|nr:rod shape-determining protein RodA [Dulcicalothrix desertica]RUT06711.1 rod shape-determining protein RodA [Dulcicalothrix desertica PCC 7102]TWH50180.1 rod shape determining protein RodA [Dulcicalothrix desertica PCC 7102]
MLLKKSSRSQSRWKYWIKPWQQIDWLLFFVVVGVSFFGGLMIRSTELSQGLIDWWWHWIVSIIGACVALIIARVRYENLLEYHWYIYTAVNISLVAVMIIGKSAKGAQRWINIAGVPVQPSEFAKLAMIITLAALLHKTTASNLSSVFRAMAFTAIPWALVFIQPDLATSLVFGAIVLGMLYWANANPGWLVLMVSPIIAAILFSIQWPFTIAFSKDLVFGPLGLIWAVAMGIVGWRTLPWKRFGVSGIGAWALNMLGGEIGIFLWNHVLKEYQKGRLTSFLNPDQNLLTTGYHQHQSRIAIGAGEWLGWGLNKGPMTQLNFVPEQHTDFIFSAVGEEFGFIGCLILLSVFAFLCLRLLHIAQTAKDNFGSLLAIGVLAMIVFQVIVNVGMNVGLAPVAGIPLPWMSYGRSAMVTNFVSLGIVESVANFRTKKKYWS